MLHFRWPLILGLIALSIYFSLSTVEYYSNFYGKETEQLYEEFVISNEFETIEDLNSHIEKLKKSSLVLGLDLQGGLHMVLELDLVDLYKNLINDEYKNNFNALDDFEIILSKVAANSDSFDFIDNLFNYESDTFNSEDLINYYSDFIPDNMNSLDEITIIKNKLKEKLEIKLNSSVEIMRNRMYALDVTEPMIQPKGNNQIIIEIAGIKDTGRAEGLIQNTGKLEFILLKDNTKSWNKILQKIDNHYDLSSLINFDSNSQVTHSILVPNSNKNEINSIINSEEVQRLLNKSQFLWGIEDQGVPGYTSFYFLNRYIELTGNEIDNPKAEQYAFDDPNSGQWYISLEFTNSNDFEEITDDNKGKFLAIVLDGEVRMAPRINQKISNGKASITGNFTKQEARDIEAVLVAGELPAKVHIISQVQVDATLGNDSINAGKISMFLAICIVLIFMLFYYKGFGLVANIAMILNVPFIIGVIATPAYKDFSASALTLPGIFGLILTIGMAIDANVIIFERIKEEILKGKKALDAIEIGYKKAFRTILDSNITTLISAIALVIFGSDILRNFGAMLVVGLICSMFTAVFITKTIIMTYFKIKPFKKLSI